MRMGFNDGSAVTIGRGYLGKYGIMMSRNRYFTILIAVVLMQGCVTAGGVPQEPREAETLQEALWRAESNRWSARVAVDGRGTLTGRINGLTKDSTSVGDARIALLDVGAVDLRSDASPALVAGAAIGFLVGYAFSGIVALTVGEQAGFVTAGAVTVTGIALAARAAKRSTEDDWHRIWSRGP
jgi:hypothetical protein